jgi:predicted PurR-regulated permease PerM
VIFGIGLLVVPPVVDGVNDLSEDLPGYVDDLRENETFREYDDRYGITEEVEEQAAELPSRLGDAAGALQDVTVGVFTSFVRLFAILVIAFFLLIDGDRILAFCYRQLPPDRERRAREVAEEVSTAISGWVFGALLLATLAGFFTYAVLSLLDVPFAVPLAILFFFFDLVPLIGATVGGILVAIVVALDDFPVALIIWGAVMLLYQQLENNVLTPTVYGRAVDIHPLVVFAAILVGAALLGILGALLAIPTAAAGQAVVRTLWRMRHEARIETARAGEPAPETPT